MKDNPVQFLQNIMDYMMQLRERGMVNVIDKPLTKGELAFNKAKIIELLKETGNSDVIKKLIPSLERSSYFTEAHCNGHHNDYDGALAQHSLGVCQNALYLAGNSIPREKVILAALLHDLCDVYDLRDQHNNLVYGGTGHGRRSLELLNNLQIHLDRDVKDVIRYHMGPSNRSEDEKRKLSYIWSSPLFNVIHVADHMDADYRHCDEIGFMGAEGFISLDCTGLHELQPFSQLKSHIETLAQKYNVRLKKTRHGHTDWHQKRCSMRLLELGEKPWDDLLPLTEACRQIARNVNNCGVTLSKIAINKNKLVLVADLDPALTEFREQLQSRFSQQGCPTTFTKNLTVRIAEISNRSGDTTRFLSELSSLVCHYTFNVDAFNLHFFKGTDVGWYHFNSQ